MAARAHLRGHGAAHRRDPRRHPPRACSPTTTRRPRTAYLNASAKLVVADPPPLTTVRDLTSWAQAAALTTQTRVQVYSRSGTLVVDSGSPNKLDAETLLGRDDGYGHGFGDHDRLPNPLGNGLFGSGGGARSARSLTMDMGNGAYVKLSEGPASGRDALVSAAVALILAAALAVGLAALAGYLVAARIARPVVALTQASDKMAGGDLGARAPVAGGDEVGRLGESFNGMAARVETTVTSLRRFVADAAHEIGTPLTALQADLELAERKAVERRRAPPRRPGARPDRPPRDALRQPAPALAPRGGRARRRRSAEHRPGGRSPRAGRRRRLPRRAGRRRARGRRDRRPAPRPRGAGAAADRARQPARQRGEVHAVGGHGDAHRASGGRRGAGHGRRHRRRHPGGGAARRSSSASTALATSPPTPATASVWRSSRPRWSAAVAVCRSPARRPERRSACRCRWTKRRRGPACRGPAAPAPAGPRVARRPLHSQQIRGRPIPPRAVTTRNARASAPAPVA